MDKKEARVILGVSKETSRNDIERKFSILLKKNKQAKEQADHVDDPDNKAAQNDNALKDTGAVHDTAASVQTEGKKEKYNFEQIMQAYNVLMGYEVAMKEEPPSKAAPLFKKAGIDEKKAKNFFYYYKNHILAVIVAIVAIVFTVKGCVNRIDPDFNIAFIGEINYTDTEKLKETIKTNIPEITEPGFDGAFISDSAAGDQQYAMLSKAMVLFAAGDIDLFILDKASYESYAKQGAFVNLDDIAPTLNVDMEKNKDNILKIENSDDESGKNTTDKSEEEHLYGIDISQSSALKESGILANELIAAFGIRSEQQDKTVKVLQLFMK